MRIKTKTILTLACLSLGVSVMAGCVGFQYGALATGARELNLFQNPDVNLRAKNYAAADYIIQQAATFINHDDLIELIPLTNFDEENVSAPIAGLIPEHIGARLTQLGYNVDFEKVSSQKESMKMSDVVPLSSTKAKKPDFVLAGHYAEDRPDLNVSLRIIQTQTKRVVGAFDYTMPTNREIRKLSKPKAQIMMIERKTSSIN